MFQFRYTGALKESRSQPSLTTTYSITLSVMLRIMILLMLVSRVFGQTVILNVVSAQQQQQQQSTVFNPLQQFQQLLSQFPSPAELFQNFRLPTIEELNEGPLAVQTALQELQHKLQANQPNFQDFQEQLQLFFQNLFDLTSGKLQDKIQTNPEFLPD